MGEDALADEDLADFVDEDDLAEEEFAALSEDALSVFPTHEYVFPDPMLPYMSSVVLNPHQASARIGRPTRSNTACWSPPLLFIESKQWLYLKDWLLLTWTALPLTATIELACERSVASKCRTRT